MRGKTVVVVAVIIALILAVFVYVRYMRMRVLYPVANAGLDKTVNEDDVVTFDGSASTDPDGTILSYIWDLGDGTTKTGKMVNHSYPSSKTYLVTLTVTDDEGHSANDTVLVRVNNVPPLAEAGPDKAVNVRQNVTFDGINSLDTPSDIPSLLFDWDFGDGQTGEGKVVTHAYISEGIYNVTLTVTDNDGAISADALVVNVTKLAILKSYSFIDERPTIEDELPRSYEVGQENRFLGGICDDGNGNLINIWTNFQLEGGQILLSKNDEDPYIETVGGGEFQVNQPGDTLVLTRRHKNAIINYSITPSIGHRAFNYSSPNITIELNTTARGIPLWYGRKQGEMVRWGHYTEGHFGGFDDPIEIEGKIERGNQTVYLSGYGNYEHSWLDIHPALVYTETWIVINTPTVYSVLLEAKGPTETYVRTGRIGFAETGKSFRADNFTVIDVDYPNTLRLVGNYTEGEFEIETSRYGGWPRGVGWYPFMVINLNITKNDDAISSSGYAFSELRREVPPR